MIMFCIEIAASTIAHFPVRRIFTSTYLTRTASDQNDSGFRECVIMSVLHLEKAISWYFNNN